MGHMAADVQATNRTSGRDRCCDTRKRQPALGAEPRAHGHRGRQEAPAARPHHRPHTADGGYSTLSPWGPASPMAGFLAEPAGVARGLRWGRWGRMRSWAEALSGPGGGAAFERERQSERQRENSCALCSQCSPHSGARSYFSLSPPATAATKSMRPKLPGVDASAASSLPEAGLACHHVAISQPHLAPAATAHALVSWPLSAMPDGGHPEQNLLPLLPAPLPPLPGNDMSDAARSTSIMPLLLQDQCQLSPPGKHSNGLRVLVVDDNQIALAGTSGSCLSTA